MIGETVSHYRILERLGAGGMGEVYKAEDTRLHRHVALKLMLADALRSDEARSRFLREAQAASALNHPNIATIYEIDEIERQGARYSFIVMEYVAGQTLSEVARRLSLGDKIEVGMQIADALSAAHDRGIVHRDIKPTNVIVGDGRRAKVLDFGVAKFIAGPKLDDETASIYHTALLETMPGTIIGTVAYMSPEQALGHDVDARSDIFSLGVVLYELFAGHLPFMGQSPIAVVDAILHSEAPPLNRGPAEVTPTLESIVHKMLEKNRDWRYQNLREVYSDLGAERQRLSGAAARMTRYLDVEQPARTGRTSSISPPPRHGHSIAVMNFTNITKNAADDWLGVGMAETVTADLKKIEGVTVIGREHIYEVLKLISPDRQPDFDEKLAARVGRDVGAKFIVGGGYQRVGEMLRITARAVEVESGEIIKTVKIDGPMNDIFGLQDKIVYELSKDIDIKLKSAERQVIEARETSVVEAFEAYTKGMMNLRQASREGLDRAITLFEKATTLDPRYARAHAALGYALELKGQFLSINELAERAIGSFQRAIALDPMIPESYSGLGLAFTQLGKDDEAIGAIRRALTFAPDEFEPRAALARAYFIGKGMFREAAVEFNRALLINDKAGWMALQMAQCYAYLGDYAKAEEAARKAIVLQEKYISGREGMQIVGAYGRLGYIFYLQGRSEDAITEYYRELVALRQSDHALKERVKNHTQNQFGRELYESQVHPNEPDSGGIRAHPAARLLRAG